MTYKLTNNIAATVTYKLTNNIAATVTYKLTNNIAVNYSTCMVAINMNKTHYLPEAMAP